MTRSKNDCSEIGVKKYQIIVFILENKLFGYYWQLLKLRQNSGLRRTQINLIQNKFFFSDQLNPSFVQKIFFWIQFIWAFFDQHFFHSVIPVSCNQIWYSTKSQRWTLYHQINIIFKKYVLTLCTEFLDSFFVFSFSVETNALLHLPCPCLWTGQNHSHSPANFSGVTKYPIWCCRQILAKSASCRTCQNLYTRQAIIYPGTNLSRI